MNFQSMRKAKKYYGVLERDELYKDLSASSDLEDAVPDTSTEDGIMDEYYEDIDDPYYEDLSLIREFNEMQKKCIDAACSSKEVTTVELDDIALDEEYEEFCKVEESQANSGINDPVSKRNFTRRRQKPDSKDVTWHRTEFSEKPMFEKPSTTSAIKEPEENFFNYLPEKLWRLAVQHTNQYIAKNMPKTLPITYDELLIYLALNIATGTYKLARLSMYWERQSGMDLFRKNMPRHRFTQIRTALHFVSLGEMNKTHEDRLYKVRPLYNALREKYLTLERPANICIDEQMVPFKGRLDIKQYLKGKPSPWGVKIFILASSETAQTLDFIIYQGHRTEYDQNDVAEYGVTGAIVLYLIQTLNPRQHNLFCDNYFFSYNLIDELCNRQINCAGTIRINRFHNPSLLEDRKLLKNPRGSTDMVVDNTGKIGILKWVDQKIVTVASNFILLGIPDQVKRTDKKEKRKVHVDRPEIIKLYNEKMGGVDLYDQLISSYRIKYRSRKWTVKLINHAIDMAVVSSYLEYASGLDKGNAMASINFRKKLVVHIIQKARKLKPRNTRRSSSLHAEKREKVRFATKGAKQQSKKSKPYPSKVSKQMKKRSYAITQMNKARLDRAENKKKRQKTPI